jgi:hypothetical protein
VPGSALAEALGLIMAEADALGLIILFLPIILPLPIMAEDEALDMAEDDALDMAEDEALDIMLSSFIIMLSSLPIFWAIAAGAKTIAASATITAR